MYKKTLFAISLALLASALGSSVSANATGVTLRAFAVSAEASSIHAADPLEYSASKATGAPDTGGGCGDLAEAWATFAPTDVATLTLTYEKAVLVSEIRIWANIQPRTVTKVETLSGSTWTTVFSREVDDVNVLGGDCNLTPRVPMTLDTAAVVANGKSWPAEAVNKVRVTVDQSTIDGWEGEIDAVELTGIYEDAVQRTTAPSISGKAKVGQKLALSPGKYTGSPKPTLSYQWYACSKKIPSVRISIPTFCSAVSGATGINLKLSSPQLGKFMSVLITASNGISRDVQTFAKSTEKVSK